MSVQQPRVFPVTFVTGSTFSNAVDLYGGFLYVAIEVPSSINTMFNAASTPFYILGSTDGSTFRRYAELNTSTVANDFSIASSVSNKIIMVPYFNSRYLKIEASGTVTGAVIPKTFTVLVTDSL